MFTKLQAIYDSLTIKGKLLLLILSLNIVIVLGIIGFSYYKFKNIQTHNSKDIIENIGQKYANQIKVDLDKAMQIAKDLHTAGEAIRKSPAANRRNLYNEYQKDILKNNSQILSVWSIWEPNAFDGLDEQFKNPTEEFASTNNKVGRYGPGYYREDGQILFTFTEEVQATTEDYYLIPKKEKKTMCIRTIF